MHRPLNHLSALNFMGGWFRLIVEYDSSVIRSPGTRPRGRTPVRQTDQPRQLGEERDPSSHRRDGPARLERVIIVPGVSSAPTGRPTASLATLYLAQTKSVCFCIIHRLCSPCHLSTSLCLSSLRMACFARAISCRSVIQVSFL